MNIFILGAGGTGRTAMGIIEKMRSGDSGLDDRIKECYFLDDNLAGQEINGYQVLGGVNKILDGSLVEIDEQDSSFVVAFGTTYMQQRKEIFLKLQARRNKLFNAIHPNVSIDKTVKIGSGLIVAGNCLINPNAVIGDNCVLCAGTIVEHDCLVADHVYLSPGVCLAGACLIEEGAFIGTNASILPEIKIGAEAVVGAGAVVTKNVFACTVMTGVPAKVLKDK